MRDRSAATAGVVDHGASSRVRVVGALYARVSPAAVTAVGAAPKIDIGMVGVNPPTISAPPRRRRRSSHRE